MKRTTVKLWLGVSGIALMTGALLSAEAACAQAAKAPAAKPADDQVVVVTGVRASVSRARDVKRKAEQIVDSLSAQDIGALPDRSVAESLQRISGVSLTRTASELTTGRPTDPGRLAPEGGGVTIRGLTGGASQSNGRDVFSAANGRTLDWSAISSDLIAGVDVYKNPSADMIEGAIAGIIDLRGRKPFDQKSRLISASADVSYGDLEKRSFVSGNALFSDRWTSSTGSELGLLLAASVNNKGTRTDSVQSSAYIPNTLSAPVDGLAAGTKVFIPGGLGGRTIDWSQSRTMYDAVVQYRPVADMLFTLDAAYSKATPHELEFANLDYSPPTVNSTDKFGPGNILISGSTPATNLDLDTRRGDYVFANTEVSLNWKYDPAGSHWAFSADLQRLKSTANVYSMTAFTEFGVEPGFSSNKRPTTNFNFGNDPYVTMSAVDGYPLDQKSSYWWAAAMDHIEHETAGEWAARADATYTFNEGFFKSFRFGYRQSNRDYLTKQSTYNWSLLSAEYWGGGTPVYLDQNVSPGLTDQSTLHTFDNFFHGKSQAPAAGWFPSASLIGSGDNAYKYLQATETAGWGWAPLTSTSYATGPGAHDIAKQDEETNAVYGLLRFGEDQGFLGRFEGNLGLRAVSTNYRTQGSFSISGIRSTLAGCQTANSADPSVCNPLKDALAFLGGDPTKAYIAEGVPYQHKYTNLLPSLNLNFHLSDELQVRFAVAKAMVRPDFHQTSPGFSYGWNFDVNGAVSPGQSPYTGTVANPMLNPLTSWQQDISVEYYWARSNSLTLALFHKDIADQIVTTAYTSSLTHNGVTLPFSVVENVNSSKHAIINGFELGYTQFYDFLPGALSGLGLQANYTYIDATGGLNSAYTTFIPNATAVTKANLPYEQLSKNAYNIAVMYAKYGIDARLAYNWREHYLLTTVSASNFSPTWMESYGQLDGSIFYDINTKVKVGVQVTNILGTKTYLDASVLENGNVLPVRPRNQITDKDRVIDLAVRARF